MIRMERPSPIPAPVGPGRFLLRRLLALTGLHDPT